MKLAELFEKKNDREGFFSYDDDDWIAFVRFAHSIHASGKSEVVFRATQDGIGGQLESKNYKATYFTPNEVYVQNYFGEGGFIGVYVISHTDKFIDLRYMEEQDGEFDYDEDEDEDVPARSEFETAQEKKLLALAQEYYKTDEPTLGNVYDMLEDPQPEFIKLLRSRGYYGMLTSEGQNSYPVYAVFNEHLKDCVKHVPWKK